MSSTGIRDSTSTESRIRKIHQENEKSFFESMKPIHGGRTSATGSNLGGNSTNSGNLGGAFLPLAGGILTGAMGFRPRLISVASNIVDVTSPSDSTVRLIVSGEGSMNDDVEFFKLVNPGASLFYSIQGVTGINLTFKNQTATAAPDALHRKIRTFDGTDLVLTGNQNLLAFYDTIANEVVIVGGTGGGGGGLSDTIYPVDNKGATSGTVIHDLSATTKHELKFIMTGNTTLQFDNYPATDNGIDWYVSFTVTGAGNYTLTWPPEVTNPPAISTVTGTKAHITLHTDDNGTEVLATNLSKDQFPIEPAVFDNGDTWTGTQTLNLADGDGHIYKWTVDQALTFAATVTNPPASARQRTFELEFVHDGVGGAFVVTLPSNFVDEFGNTLASFTISSGFAILTCRVNDGGSTYLVVQKNVAGVTAGLTQTPWTSDIDAATFDLTNLDRLLYSQTAGNTLISTTTGVTSSAAGDLSSNVPTGGSYFKSINGVNISTLQEVSGDPIFQIKGTDNATPAIRVLRADSTPSVGASVGSFQLWGADSGGVIQEQFASITADAEDLTPGAVSGSLHLTVDNIGLPVTYISLNNANDGKLTVFKNLHMDTNIDIEMDGNDIWFDSGLTRKFVNGTSGIEAHVDSALQATITNGGIALPAGKSLIADAVILNPNDTVGTTNGTIRYDLSENKFKAYENGAEVDMIGGGSFADQQLSNLSGTVAVNVDLDPSSTDVRDIGNTTFRWQDLFIQNIDMEGKLTVVDTSTLPAAAGEIRRDGDTIAAQIDELRIINETTVGTDFAHFTLLKKDDGSAADDIIGNISFSVLDNSTTTTYARVHSEIEDQTDAGKLFLQVRNNNSGFTNGIEIVGTDGTSPASRIAINSRIDSDLVFSTSGSTDFKIYPAVQQLGIVVEDDTSFTVGDKGTVAVPTHNLAVTPTAAQIDTQFGTHKGAIGLDEPTTPGVDNARLFVRNSDGSWYSFNADARFT